MMKLVFNNQEIEAEEVTRKVDVITCKTQGFVIAEFRGILDFSGYTLKTAEGDELPLIEASQPMSIEEQLAREIIWQNNRILELESLGQKNELPKPPRRWFFNALNQATQIYKEE